MTQYLAILTSQYHHGISQHIQIDFTFKEFQTMPNIFHMYRLFFRCDIISSTYLAHLSVGCFVGWKVTNTFRVSLCWCLWTLTGCFMFFFDFWAHFSDGEELAEPKLFSNTALGKSPKKHILSAYLIFVIFCTPPHFLACKSYARKVRKFATKLHYDKTA